MPKKGSHYTRRDGAQVIADTIRLAKALEGRRRRFRSVDLSRDLNIHHDWMSHTMRKLGAKKFLVRLNRTWWQPSTKKALQWRDLFHAITGSLAPENGHAEVAAAVNRPRSARPTSSPGPWVRAIRCPNCAHLIEVPATASEA